MPATRIDALCECEGCQKRFGVELELATNLGRGFFKDFDSLARKAIISGQTNYYVWGVRGKTTVDRLPLSGFPSIQGGRMLCDDCTKKCNAIDTENDRELTAAEVERALGMRGSTP